MLFTFGSPEDSFTKPLLIIALFGVLELAANSFLEPMIYGKTTGVSALALLVSAMFWTWLWGGIGLLLSTPLTVCLAVLGKYVPSLKFFATFLREEIDLDPGVRFYQRLLAMDQDGTSAVIDTVTKTHPRAEVFDKVLVPTLSMAERDFLRGDIDEREQAFILRVISDVLGDLEGEPEIDLASLSTANEATSAQVAREHDGTPEPDAIVAPRILALPVSDASDVLVLRLLDHLMGPSKIPLTIVEEVETPLKVVERITADSPDVVLLSHLPPDGLTAARYLVRRIKARHPHLTLVVGRCGASRRSPRASSERLLASGTSVVLGSLSEARDYLVGLTHKQAHPVKESIGALAPAAV